MTPKPTSTPTTPTSDEDWFGVDEPPPEPTPPPRQEPVKKPPKTRQPSDGSRPENVPILVEEDLVWEGQYQNGRRDLRHWMIATFGEDTAIRAEAEEAFGEAVRIIAHGLYPGSQAFVEQANRNRWPSLAQQAVCWNEMLSDLGYDIPKASRTL